MRNYPPNSTTPRLPGTLVSLNVAVKNVAIRLKELHVDIKANRKETFTRLNVLEARVAVLEAKS